MPTVVDASASMSTSGASGMERVCTRRICSRPTLSGGLIVTRRSKRPGRRSAGSSTSGRFVAASTITPVVASKPSISVRIWFSVCSRSSFAPLNAPLPRERPIASISSTKMIDGAAFFAWSKRSRTREAPTPTIISTNSEADIEKNGTPAWPATARASSVFPVPGAPLRSTPRGMRAPSLRYLVGSRRKSTTSASSCSASSIPAMSSNVTRSVEGSYCRAFALPNENMPPPAAPARRMNQIQRPKKSSVGPTYMSAVNHHGVSLVAGFATTSTPFSRSNRSSSAPSANSGTSVAKSVVAVASASG